MDFPKQEAGPVVEASATPRRLGLQYTFAALQHRNYRLWFIGQMVSLMGTWMQGTAQAYLVYELTRSSAFLGYIGFCAGVPSWLLMLYGGVVADRIPRRKLLYITQSIFMVLSFILAALIFSHLIQPWHILAVAVVFGITTAFDVPARQSFVTELVPKEHLTNAIALNSTMFNSAVAVGPALAGIVYATFGPGWCFLSNAISFPAVIVALKWMRLKDVARLEKQGPVFGELAEGVRYAVRHPMIRTLILLVGGTTLLSFSFTTLVPAWAVKILHGDAKVNGFLQSARGLGAFCGALTIASISHFHIKGRILTIGSIAFPAFLFVFAFVTRLHLSLIILVLMGASLIQIFNVANALVQSLTPDHLRGRVMGVYSLVFFGMMPLGALWIGTAAQHFSEPLALKVAAAASLAVSIAVYLAAPKLRELK
jgi:MFS family permease